MREGQRVLFTDKYVSASKTENQFIYLLWICSNLWLERSLQQVWLYV